MGLFGRASGGGDRRDPDRPAVCFVGDGSIPVGAAEPGVGKRIPFAGHLEHSRRPGPGIDRDVQEYSFGNRIFDTDFQFQPDFATLARACGCYGEQIDEPGDVRPAVERALEANQSGRAAVLDFRVARARMAQTYEHFGFYKR